MFDSVTNVYLAIHQVMCFGKYFFTRGYLCIWLARLQNMQNLSPEPRKRTILPRNRENFSETAYIFWWLFFTFFFAFFGQDWFTFYIFFGLFTSNHRKNHPNSNISYVKYQIFLLFITIFLGTRFLGSSENLDSAWNFLETHQIFFTTPLKLS